MSNTLAIATLSAVLEGRIKTLLNTSGLAGFDVVAEHPKGDSPDPGVYIQVYRVVPSAALRNTDLPTRRSEGTLAQRPRLALDVELLLTFVGEAGNYDAERLAGLVMTELHANPSLGKQEINDFMAGLPPEHVLEGADLGDQLERVRFTLLGLNLEDLSRVWGLYGASSYGLSVAYHAGPLLLDAAVRPATPLPVLSTGLQIVPSVGPSLLALSSSSSSQPLAQIGDTLVVRGSGLRAPITVLRIGELEQPLTLADVSQERIQLVLDAGLGLLAGVHAVQVVHRAEIGPPSDPLRTIAQSNALPLALVPKVLAASANGSTLSVEVVPLPTSEQDVTVTLDPLPSGTQLSSTDFAVNGNALDFTMASMSAGDYLVRVRVDGVTSLLVLGPSQMFESPKVSVP